MKVWGGCRAGPGLAPGIGACGHCAVCCAAEGTRVVSDSRVKLHSKQIVPGNDALCQSYSQITKRLDRVKIDIQRSYCFFL